MKRLTGHIIRNKIDVITTTVLLVLFSGLIAYNTAAFEVSRERARASLERHQALEAKQLERQAAREATRELIEERRMARNQEISDIIAFDEELSRLKEEYISSIDRISGEMENKVTNIDDLISLTDERIEAAEEFMEGLEDMETPEVLQEFHLLLLEFLENDIHTWQETRSYYSGDYTGGNQSLEELHRKNSELFQQVDRMQSEIYSSYGLEDLL
jgi:chromosome segregation ATPase